MKIPVQLFGRSIAMNQKEALELIQVLDVKVLEYIVGAEKKFGHPLGEAVVLEITVTTIVDEAPDPPKQGRPRRG